MPEYRSSDVKGTGGKFGAASKYLNLQKVFNDAVRQNQWKAEQDWRNNSSDINRTKISAASQLASQGMQTPAQYEKNTSYQDPYSGQQVPGMEMSGTSNKMDKQNLISTTKLRQEFINRPEVKDYVVISTQVKSMDALLNKAMKGDIQNKVALDQALITMYNKLTDPQSVVRESEYARSGEDTPTVNKISAAIQKITKGGKLTDSDRQALVQGAKIIADERGNTYNSTLNDYKDLATGYELNPDLILGGRKAHTPYSSSQSNMPSFNSEEEANKANLKPGTKIIVNGRQAVWE
jgi:hypothetical protein